MAEWWESAPLVEDKPASTPPSSEGGWWESAPLVEEKQAPGGESSAGSILGRSLLRGTADAIEGVGESGQFLVGGRHAMDTRVGPSDDPELDNLLKQTVGEGWRDPNWWIANTMTPLAGSSPTLAGAIGGAALGGSATRSPYGAAVGGAGGASAAAVLQTLGPAYKRALQDGLSSDEAFDRAWTQAGVSAGFSAVAGALPMAAAFGRTAEGALKKPIKEALLQMFVAQPAVGVTEQAVQTNIEGKEITADALAKAYIGEAVAGGVLDVGTNLATGGYRSNTVSERGPSTEEAAAIDAGGTTPQTPTAPPATPVAQDEALAMSGQPVESVADRARRISKERQATAAQAAANPGVISAPPTTESQPTTPASAAGTEPPAASVGDVPAVPPSTTEAPTETPATETPTEATAPSPAAQAAAALEPAQTENAEAKKSEFFEKAAEAVQKYNRASPGFFAARLGIGIKRAQKLAFELEDAGLIEYKGGQFVPVTAESNPAPAPAVDTNTVPESPETLEEQRLALRQGTRDVVFYPDGTPPPGKAPGPNIERTKIEKFGIFDYNRTKTSPKQIREAAKAGTLNELLGLGPVNKEAVAESIAAGNPEAAVVERTPEGTEVKAAAGTVATALDQLTALKGSKAAPENTVAVESPAKVLSDRLEQNQAPAAPVRKIDPASLSPEDRARYGIKEVPNAPQTVATPKADQAKAASKARAPEGPKPVEAVAPVEAPKARVLKDVSEKGKQEASYAKELAAEIAAKTKAENKKAEKAAAPSTGKNRTKAEKAKRVGVNSKADELFARTAPFSKERETELEFNHPEAKRRSAAREAIHTRAKAILQAARDAGLKLPAKASDNVDESMDLSAGALGAINARDLFNALQGGTRPREEIYQDFLTSDMLLRAGDRESVLGKRRVDADVASRVSQDSSELGSASETPESELLASEGKLGDARETTDDSDGTTGAERDDSTDRVSEDASPEDAVTDEVTPDKDETKINRQFDWPVDKIKEMSSPDKAPFAKDLAVLRAWAGSLSDADYRVLTEHAAYDFPRIMGTTMEPGRLLDAWQKTLKAKETVTNMPGDYSKALSDTQRQLTTDGAPAETGAYTEVRTTKAFTSETKPKKRKLMKRASIDGDENVADLDEADVVEQYTLAQAVEKSGGVEGSGTNRAIIDGILARLARRAGKVPVKVVHQETLDAMFPDRPAGNVNGFFDPNKNHIIVSSDFLKGGEFDARLLAHEGVHAYLQRALDNDATLKKDFQDILDYVKSQSARQDVYGFKDVHEFLAEALSNPAFQNMLMGITVPKRLAAKYGVPTKGSMWDAMTKAVAKFLGLGRKDIDALTYVLRLGERAEISAARDPDSKLISEMQERGLLSAGRRREDNIQSLIAGNVDEDTAVELADFLEAEIGKSIDPATVPLLIGDFIKEFAKAPSNLKGKASWLRNAALKMNTLDYIRQNYNGYFDGLLDRLVKTVQKREKIVSDVAEKHDKDASDLVELSMRNPEEARELATIATEASRLNVKIEGDNKHLGKEAKRGLQAKKQLPALQARFAKLSPEAQALYRRMVKNYRDTHNENIRAIAYNVLTRLEFKNPLSNSDLMMLLDKVVDGNLSVADADLIGDPEIFKELKAATSLRTIQGDYFPQMRFGNFVVLTTDTIPNPNITSVTLKGKAGTKVPVKTKVEGNTVSFTVDPSVRGAQTAVNRAVSEYITNNDLTLLAVRKRSIDRQTGRVTPSGEQLVGRDYDVVFEVDLQTQGVSFFETRKEAQKFRDETHKPGVTKSSEVLDRRESGNDDKLIQGSALTQVTKRINADKALPDWQKRQLQKAVHQAIISQMTGNRAQARHMARRNVKGASADIARAAVTYGQSAGNYYATLTTAPDLREAMAELDKFESKNQMKEGAGVRSQVMQELRKRQETLDDPLYYNKFMQNVATLSFFDKLVSPAYSIVNFQQVIGNSLPYLGGEYGYGKAASAVASAYGKIGTLSTIASGVKNTAVAGAQFKKSSIDVDDLLGSIRKNLGPKYDALMDELETRGLIDPNSGFEIGQALIDGSGPVNTALAKFDRVARQLPGAVEAVNRMVTAVAAYDLATSAGNSGPKAIEAAYNAVSMTQGDYRKSNNPRFMNDPKLSWALQFKKYAVLQTQLIGDYYVKALKGATPKEREIAAKRLAGQMATQVMYAGALGLPGLEVVKLALSVVSITFPEMGWDEFEEWLKGILDESIGETPSELIRKGVVTRAIGIDVSDRMSQADLWSGFVPDTLDKEGLTKYVGALFLGAPGSTLFDWGAAGANLVSGNFEKAFEQAFPVKMVADTTRAIGEYRRGRMNEKEAVIKSLGFQPRRTANINEETGREIREGREIKAEKNKIIKAWLDATSAAERTKVIARMREFNAGVPERQRLSLRFLNNIRNKQMQRYEEE